MSEITVAAPVSSIDSARNCLRSCARNPPNTFRTPISFIRSVARLTARLIKLMMAIPKINTAIDESV